MPWRQDIYVLMLRYGNRNLAFLPYKVHGKKMNCVMYEIDLMNRCDYHYKILLNNRKGKSNAHMMAQTAFAIGYP